MEKCNAKYCGCLYYSSNALSRIMTKMADEEFAPVGLSPSYAFMLMSINGKPGIQPKELSEHMMLAPSTVTRLVEKLEYRNYIERRNSGRVTEIHPTGKSLELDGKIKECWNKLYIRYSKLIGEDDGKKLTRDINTAIDKIDF